MAPPPDGDPLLSLLAEALSRKPAVRQALRTLAVEVLALLDRVESPANREATAVDEVVSSTGLPAADLPATGVEGGAEPTAAPTPARFDQPVPPSPRRPAVLRIGDVERVVEVAAGEDQGAAVAAAAGFAGPRVVAAPAPPYGDVGGSATPDLSLVVERCRLKVEACRWAVDRRRRMAEGEDYRTFADSYRDLVARAKALRDCYLWMIPADAQLPSDEEMEHLAGAYAALADAAELTLTLMGAGGADAPLADAFRLLAEAQSALRAGLVPVLDYREDFDPRDAFWWLRGEAFERQIFIERHMRVDDPASPADSAGLRHRVAEMRRAWEERHRHGKERRNLLGKVRYQASKAAKARPESAAAEWQRLDAVVSQAVAAAGLPPTSADLRDALLALEDVLDGPIPEIEFSPAMRAALDELDRHLAARAAPPAAEPPAERTWGPDVRRVAELLAGKKLVLIGGERRPAAVRALEEAFGLNELIWPTSHKHESLSTFEPDVAKPSVAAVVVAIRWSSHSFGELASVCAKYGKPFVRLKAGYNPNQVAKAIVEQAGDVLAATHAAAAHA